MSVSVKVSKIAVEGATSLTGKTTWACDLVSKISETIPDGTTDDEYVFGIGANQLLALAIFSDRDLTIKTNDSVSPQDTLNLTANKPILWKLGDVTILSGDVDSFFITNASGADAQLKVIVGAGDPTNSPASLPGSILLDESGAPILDEYGQFIFEE